jgi:hypothetical protein
MLGVAHANEVENASGATSLVVWTTITVAESLRR